MMDKILFMIVNDEIKFLPKSSTMDHKEWYNSLGMNPDEYDNIIRGYVIENYCIFFKANLNYDSEVIDVATICGPIIKKQLNRPELKVCCGINPGHDGSKWEPIVMLKGKGLEAETKNTKDTSRIEADTKIEEHIEELKDMPYEPTLEEKKDENKTDETQIEKLTEEQPIDPLIKFNNNFSDPEFIKYATKFNIVMIVLTIIVKILLFSSRKLMLQDRWGILLMIAQVGGLALSTYFYQKKNPYAKYISLVSAIALFFMFDLFDIVLGILVLFFTIDQNYIVKLMEYINKGLEKVESFIEKNKTKKQGQIINKNPTPNIQTNKENSEHRVYAVSNMGEQKAKPESIESLDDLTKSNNNNDNEIL